MGSNFSTGAFRPEILNFVNRDLIYIKSRVYRFRKMLDRNFEEDTFITKRQLQWILQLNDLDTYYVFKLFDTGNKGKISRIEFFGALALATSDSPNDKIGFCFTLSDDDGDEHLSQVDFETAVLCVTRGFSCLKEIAFPSIKTIKKLSNELFKKKSTVLNEKGCVCIRDVRAFCFANDQCRTYFASLGTAVEAHDSGKLVRQRADLLAELAAIEVNIGKLKALVADSVNDKHAYQVERGGDSALLKLNDSVLDSDDAQHEDLESGSKKKDELMAQMLAAASGGMTEAQRLRRMKRRADRKETGIIIKDANVFERGCKPTATKSIGTDKVFERSMQFKWATLEPQADDKLFSLDIDCIEDLFEAAGGIDSFI